MALDGAALQNLEVHRMPTPISKLTADLAACYICTLRLCVICYCIFQAPFGCAMLCGQPHQHDHLLLLTTILKSSWHSKHSKHSPTNSLHVTGYIALCEAAKWLGDDAGTGEQPGGQDR